jgi:hypothetical protein
VHAHPALYSRFKFIQERGKLTSKKPVGIEGDTKVFEGEAAFRKTRILEDTLLNTDSNSTKINRRFPCINV